MHFHNHVGGSQEANVLLSAAEIGTKATYFVGAAVPLMFVEVRVQYYMLR
jgi:hypothetical protein